MFFICRILVNQKRKVQLNPILSPLRLVLFSLSSSLQSKIIGIKTCMCANPIWIDNEIRSVNNKFKFKVKT